ncbi:UDP-N-acetylglucosamine--N-acetylmuramyl-(pentapeptide) pyrophosphoryl-undecaprenol N-acetylglucosamine transferase [Gammaproteobacteria bacterium SCGC AG-212-F23]|nr:UDP-N-acetylglucosamine--N-acetylmuramyl-(pentapeptide) pyrophosphoryl-undecaprenol N-acetylglucosamine transferase [Gammaproteobacteria bacterium SCGC AG-212-F23]
MKTIKRVLMMAGGTGGHVFPGLAVAHKFREQNIEVYWLGTKNGLEAKVVPAAGFPIEFISIAGVRGKGLRGLLLAPFRLFFAVIQSWKIIRRLQPDVVIGMGGFVSGPGGLASRLLNKKLVIHEQNAKAGLTNRYLAWFAARVLQGFPETFKSSKKIITTGNPVRAEIAAIPAPEQRMSVPQKSLRLLVLGGSLGAQAINECVPKVLSQMCVEDRPQVLHQTGEKHFAETKKIYEALHLEATVVPFIQDMATAYANADMVLCRAGALTIAELCAAGVGAILIPFPHAVDDHQTINAAYMVKEGAAILLLQSAMTVTTLSQALQKLIASRQTMAVAAYKLRKTDATDTVVKICKEISYALDI